MSSSNRAEVPFSWYDFGTKITIDSAGRLVVPKAIRELLGFRPGQELELQVRDGRLEIGLRPTPMRLKGKGRSLTAVPTNRVPPLTSEQVRETLEQLRR